MYSCNICDKTFTLRKNLNRHRRSHYVGAASKFSCDVCDFSSPRADTLKRHQTGTHSPAKISSESKKISCVLCNNFSCADRKIMMKHYKSGHDVCLQQTSLEFYSEIQFQAWKLSIEKDEHNQYVRNTGQRVTIDGKSITYVCFRDGSYKPKGFDVRHKKMMGSNKINGFCPAKMVATTFSSGKIKVEYCKTHVGHSNDISRMRLPKHVRDEIACKIAMKMNRYAVLDSIRLSVTTDKLDRQALITMKDIFNVARDYNLEAEGVRDKNDSTRVRSRVKEKSNVKLPRDDLQSKQELAKKGFQKLFNTASTSEGLMDKLLVLINQNQATLDAAKSLHENSTFTREEPASRKRKILRKNQKNNLPLQL